MWQLSAAVVVWACVAGSAVFWGLRLFVAPQAVPPGTPVAALGASGGADLARVLGEDPSPAVTEAEAQLPQSERFKLIGVLSPPASRAQREGVALIAIDDQPAKAYRIGAAIEGDTVLQAVQARGAVLGTRDGVALVSLQLAPPAPPATGTLPAAGAPALPPRSGPMAPPMPGDKGLPRRPGAAQPLAYAPRPVQQPMVQTPQSVMQTHLGQTYPGQTHQGAESGADDSNADEEQPTAGGLPVR